MRRLKTNKKLICARCGHDWLPRVEEPRRCPRCQVWFDDMPPKAIPLSQEGY